MTRRFISSPSCSLLLVVRSVAWPQKHGIESVDCSRSSPVAGRLRPGSNHTLGQKYGNERSGGSVLRALEESGRSRGRRALRKICLFRRGLVQFENLVHQFSVKLVGYLLYSLRSKLYRTRNTCEHQCVDVSDLVLSRGKIPESCCRLFYCEAAHAPDTMEFRIVRGSDFHVNVHCSSASDSSVLSSPRFSRIVSTPDRNSGSSSSAAGLRKGWAAILLVPNSTNDA